MIKYVALSAAALLLTLAVPRKPVMTSGSWKVDERHSHAQLSADGTTDFGKTKMTMTLGLARVDGTVKMDASDPTNSAFDFHVFPATSMNPPIGEDGKVKIEWFANRANNTLVCFHSKGTRQTADGRLQTTGDLTVTRVDRNVEATASESYSGPVYGPAIIHLVTRPATFVFDVPAAAGPRNGGDLQTSGTTSVFREDFPQLVKTVVATYWPPVIQDANCRASTASEAYAGAQCTGTFMMAPALPEAPGFASESYTGPAGFNAVVGEHLTIVVHMRLKASGSGAQSGAGN